MTETVFRAIDALQKQCFLTHDKSARELELYERAIDKLVRNPNITGDAFRVARDALSDARKILRRRGQLLPLSTLEAADVPLSSEDKVVELEDWLERTPDLSEADRTLLERVANGVTAEDIAGELGLPVSVVRVRISRARARARQAWAS